MQEPSIYARLAWAILCAASVAGCATPEPPAEPEEPLRTMPGEDTPCTADSAQRFIGQSATQEVGEAIMIATRARIFQWVGPDTMVTMDYRMDRVRVSYDKDMKISAVRCG